MRLMIAMLALTAAVGQQILPAPATAPIVSTSTATSTAEHNILLKGGFKAGQSWLMTVTHTIGFVQHPAKPAVSQVTLELRLDVREADDGLAIYVTTLSAKAKTPGSVDPSDLSDVSFRRWKLQSSLISQHCLMRLYVDCRFKFLVDAKGKVVLSEGVDKQVDASHKLLSETGVKIADLKERHNFFYLRAVEAPFRDLPGEAVRKGDSWAIEQEMPGCDHGKTKYHLDATLKGIRADRNKREAIVSLSGAAVPLIVPWRLATTQPMGASTQPNAIRDASGEMVFDVAQGLVTRYEVRSHSKPTGANGLDSSKDPDYMTSTILVELRPVPAASQPATTTSPGR